MCHDSGERYSALGRALFILKFPSSYKSVVYRFTDFKGSAKEIVSALKAYIRVQ